MEFRQLESFCAVVRYQSFTKAAEKLYISQPTISTHIRMLEQEFNSRLIIRTTKNIEITPHGKELFACAQKIFTLKNDLIQKWSEENKKSFVSVLLPFLPIIYYLKYYHYFVKNIPISNCIFIKMTVVISYNLF